MVRRDLLEDLSRLTQTAALVAITGSGGNGKTIALWHWIEECLQSSLPEQQGVYYALVSAEDTTDECIGEQLYDWAHVPHGHAWRAQAQPEMILQRLHAASRTGAHPILFLGIDAVDETLRTNNRSKIATVLRWFWEEGIQAQREQRFPCATAIVTCRDKDILLREYLYAISPFEDLGTNNLLAELSINAFSDEELLAAAQQQFTQETFVQFQQAITMQSTLSSTHTDFLNISPSRSFSPLILQNPVAPLPLDAQILKSLHHPVLWRCFLSLPELKRLQVLDGNVEALTHLRRTLLSWFCFKAKKRGNPLTQKELEDIINDVAQQCPPHSTHHHTRAQWAKAVVTTGLMNEYLANQFFEEAFSAGLILRDGNQWYWDHAFILQQGGRRRKYICRTFQNSSLKYA